MKTSSSVLLAAVAAAAFAISADVQAFADGLGKGPGAYPMDCTKAKDKTRCEALNKDIAACKDKLGDEWRECMHQPAQTAKFTPPKLRDCAKARNRVRCEAHNTALDACKDNTTRAEHRKCMAAQSPATGKR
ncbi:MAG: hypothetical protein IH604_09320 [Burkholderiales bacterium]|nr:hypothetical protein [Burkholderiales bacterium]